MHPSVVGRRVEVRADLARVQVSCEGRLFADHERVWARHQTVTDPEHRTAAIRLRHSAYPVIDRAGAIVTIDPNTGERDPSILRHIAQQVAARVGGELRDLAHVLADGDEVQGVDISSGWGKTEFEAALDFIEGKIEDGYIRKVKGNSYMEDLTSGNAVAGITCISPRAHSSATIS